MENVRAHAQGGKILAGGTDLIMAMREKNLRPTTTISLRKLGHDLDYLTFDPDSSALRIGALTTLHTIQTSSLPDPRIQLLSEAASKVGGYQIRNRGTIGGNICNASPAGDLLPPLMVLDATFALASSNGVRTVPVGAFFIGPGRTKIANDEILKEVTVGRIPGKWGASFAKIASRENGISIVSIATLVSIEGGTVRDARVSFGAVAPTPVRVKNVEDAVRGADLRRLDLSRAYSALEGDIKPISDVRAGEAYRRRLARVLLGRSLETSIRRAEEAK